MRAFDEGLDVVFGLAAAVLIAAEIEFEASQTSAVFETLKKMEDSVISHMFAVPEPKLELLKNAMVNDLSKLVKPGIGDLVTPTEIDVHLAEINEPVQRICELAPEIFSEVMVFEERKPDCLDGGVHAYNLMESIQMVLLNISLHIKVNRLVMRPVFHLSQIL